MQSNVILAVARICAMRLQNAIQYLDIVYVARDINTKMFWGAQISGDWLLVDQCMLVSDYAVRLASVLFIAHIVECRNKDPNCPDVEVKTITSSSLLVPSTTTLSFSTTQTQTQTTVTTQTVTQTNTESSTTCYTKAPIPTSVNVCSLEDGKNLCDETTRCDPITKMCICKQGYKFTGDISSSKQWRLAVGGPVYVDVGLKCDLGKLLIGLV